MHLIWDDRRRLVAQWVAERIPQMDGAEGFGLCQACGVIGRDGEPLAGIVFHNWLPRYRNIEVSFAAAGTVRVETAAGPRLVASARWLTRPLIKEILAYPFGRLECRRITALTPKKARSARRFLDAFGFKREGCVRAGFGDDDMIVSGLLAEEWEQSRFNRSRVARSAPTPPPPLSPPISQTPAPKHDETHLQRTDVEAPALVPG